MKSPLRAFATIGAALAAVLEIWTVIRPYGLYPRLYQGVLVVSIVVAIVSYRRTKRSDVQHSGPPRWLIVAVQTNALAAWVLYAIVAPPPETNFTDIHVFGGALPLLQGGAREYQTVYLCWLASSALFLFLWCLLPRKTPRHGPANELEPQPISSRTRSVTRKRILIGSYLAPSILFVLGLLLLQTQLVSQSAGQILVIVAGAWIGVDTLVVGIVLMVSGLRTK